MTATELVTAYYNAFNAGDMPAFLALLSEDVIHDINQGERQMGQGPVCRVHGQDEPLLPRAAG